MNICRGRSKEAGVNLMIWIKVSMRIEYMGKLLNLTDFCEVHYTF